MKIRCEYYPKDYVSVEPSFFFAPGVSRPHIMQDGREAVVVLDSEGARKLAKRVRKLAKAHD